MYTMKRLDLVTYMYISYFKVDIALCFCIVIGLIHFCKV